MSGQWLKFGTETHVKLGPFLSTDGVIPSTGLTPVVEIAKSTAAFAVTSGTSNVHDAEGWYDVRLTTDDTDQLGRLYAKAMSTADHLPVRDDFMVVPANVFNSYFSTEDLLDVNVKEISDQSTAADDLEAKIANLDANIAGVETKIDTIQTDLDNSTDGLGALKILIDTVDDFIDTEVAAIQTDLDNSTDGLGALKTLIDALPSGSTIGDVVWSEATRTLTGGFPTQLQKNQALSNFQFLMVSTDHVTPKTALSAVKVTESIDSAAFAATANSTDVAEVGNGIYTIDLTAADLNGNTITLRFASTETGVDDTLLSIITQPSS